MTNLNPNNLHELNPEIGQQFLHRLEPLGNESLWVLGVVVTAIVLYRGGRYVVPKVSFFLTDSVNATELRPVHNLTEMLRYTQSFNQNTLPNLDFTRVVPNEEIARFIADRVRNGMPNTHFIFDAGFVTDTHYPAINDITTFVHTIQVTQQGFVRFLDERVFWFFNDFDCTRVGNLCEHFIYNFVKVYSDYPIRPTAPELFRKLWTDVIEPILKTDVVTNPSGFCIDLRDYSQIATQLLDYYSLVNAF